MTLLIVLVRLAGPGALVFNVAQNLGHVFDLFANLSTHIDWSTVLRGHGNTVAGSRIDLDALTLMQLVLSTQN